MSPYTNIVWDPSRLRLVQDGVTQVQGGVRRGRRVSHLPGRFIAGPIDVAWVIQAGRLGVKTLLVGLLLWHLRGLRRSDSFIVSNLLAHEWGIKPDAKWRSLRNLEKNGLIDIDRRGRRSPRVTLRVPSAPIAGKVDGRDPG